MLWSSIAAILPLLQVVHSQSNELDSLNVNVNPQKDSFAVQGLAPAPPYRSELLSLHKSLVSIPSLSGDEGNAAKFLVKYLTKKGYRTHLQPVEANDTTPPNSKRFNVLVWRGDKDRRKAKVLVTSHIDVVPPYIDYGIDDGDVNSDTMIWGRGSVDAKGSVAAMITAVEELSEQGKISKEGEDVMFLFVVGEEVAGDGMKSASETWQQMDDPPTFDAVIFGEPTENKLACGHKGGLNCVLHAKGEPGHSGYPWLGKSANELMIKGLSRVIGADLGSSELFGSTTVNVGKIQGGVAANVIAEDAMAKLMTRVAIGPQDEGGKLVESRMRAILEDVDKEALTLECSTSYGVVETDCDVNGFDTITVNYGTDVPHLAGDHTRYLYGPGNILVAHGAHENLTVSDLETAVEDYQRLILHALKKDSAPTVTTPAEL